MRLVLLLLCPLLLLLSERVVAGTAQDFQNWVINFKAEALRQGVTPQVFDDAFRGVQPIPRVIELDRKQPERTRMGFSKYLSNVKNQKRIDNGRLGLSNNRQILAPISQHYGVPSEIIVALWGIETSYGSNTGNYDLIAALATLAWEGRRAQFFKGELINALLILQGNHITRDKFKGSWAGAMGQNQFMPSSWHRFAVDFDGDGHKDIWTNRGDVFASAANYLARNGWDRTQKWGYAVKLPVGVGQNKDKKTYLAWLQSGVRFDGTPPSIPSQTPLTLIIPDGGDGRAFLVTKNYDVIMSWNRSTYFALTVGLLSDAIALRQYSAANPANDNTSYQNSSVTTFNE
jgi:membrane-bound lytic murein transglycosylase B